MRQIPRSILTISVLFVTGVLLISFASLSPIQANADWQYNKQIPEITGTITVDGTQGYEDLSKINLNVAMSVGEYSVSNGKAIYGKLNVVQGFLVYNVGVLGPNDEFYKVVVDAGTGEALYVSDAITKDSYKKHKDKTRYNDKSNHKMKNYYANMSPEEKAEKKRQFGEMKDAFMSISLGDRATLITYFMQMKLQWDGMSDDDKAAKRAEMKTMWEGFLTLSVEEKINKLEDFAKSVRNN